MRRPVRWGWRTRGQAAVLAAVLLTLALAFCAVHQEPGADGHGMFASLCLGMVVVAVTIVLLGGPVPSGQTVLATVPVLRGNAPRVLEPPPRFSVRS